MYVAWENFFEFQRRRYYSWSSREDQKCYPRQCLFGRFDCGGGSKKKNDEEETDMSGEGQRILQVEDVLAMVEEMTMFH